MKGDVIDGVKPATIVHEGETSIGELEAMIKATREAHGDLLHQYHAIWYNASHTWAYTHFLGVGLMKCPNDLWMYQSIITDLRPQTIIETGTYAGGSALWFAYLMDMLGIKDGRVFTVDFEDHRTSNRVDHPRVTFLAGDSVDPTLVRAIEDERNPGPLLVCLDSDHSSAHVRKELELYAPLCQVGDWLVVEDTNIGWSDGCEHRVTFKGDLGKCECGIQFFVYESLRANVAEDVLESALRRTKCPANRNDRGARGGLQDYMDQHPNEWRQDLLSERYLLTMNPGGWLQRMAECSHG